MVHISTLKWCLNLVQVIGFCVAMIVLVKWGAGISEWRDVIASENGPVERMSAAIWFMGFGWSLVAGWCDKRLRVEWWIMATFSWLFGLRELDAHIWATGWNLDKLANYWNPQIPIGERLLVLGFMVLPSLFVGIIFCGRIWQSLGPAWRVGADWLNHLLVALALLGICLTLDKIGPYVLPLLGIGESGQLALMIIEEFLEMVLAVFVLVTQWPYLQEALLEYE